MLGYEHTGHIAAAKDGEKKPFDYRHLQSKRSSRHDYLPGYTDKKRTTKIETIDCIDAKADYVVWLEGESKHRRVVSVESERINDLRGEKYIILELE